MERVLGDGFDAGRGDARRGRRPLHLDEISDPADLRRGAVEDLVPLAEEIREFLVSLASAKGGHFASSLGAVELTLALHYVFDTPRDRLVWDVGHQAYVHKILTGRRDRMHTIRQYGGLSGFLKRSESPYDAFGAGHASTAVSAALGIATARDLLGETFKVVAIVGDGAMTGGLSFEALNNAGASGRDLLVVLNDNAMSISPNVGAVAHYLTSLTTHPRYRRMKEELYAALRKLPRVGGPVGTFARRLEQGIKTVLVPGALFEALGFTYRGPIDGHDLPEMVRILEQIRDSDRGPVLLHVLTRKGKGYEPAEKDPASWHGVGPFDPHTGVSRKSSGGVGPTFTSVFGDAIVERARRDPRVVAITAAMPDGTGLSRFAEEYPDRFFDVGIAEGHAVTFAAGLAAEGLRPVCALYSTFLQRAVDHLVHDVALQDLPVVFAVDRAGLVGADGPTHHGVLDLAWLRAVPGMVVAAPRDADALADLLETALEQDERPFAIRWPRDTAPGPRTREPRVIPVGTWETVREGGGRVVILAVGTMVGTALEAAEILAAEDGLDVTVVDARFVKPLDRPYLRELARSGPELVVTLEEGTIRGGFGDAVHEASLEEDLGLSPRLVQLALPDRFVTHGSRAELLAEVGMTAEGVATQIRGRMGR